MRGVADESRAVLTQLLLLVHESRDRCPDTRLEKTLVNAVRNHLDRIAVRKGEERECDVWR